MKKHKLRVFRMLRCSLALLLSVLMLSTTVTTAFAAQKSENQMSSALKKLLLDGGESYPEGAYALLDTKINMNEGDKDKTITVARVGKTDCEAEVDFNVVDVSSRYGVDFELYTMGAFGKEILKASEDKDSLMKKNGEHLNDIDDKTIEKALEAAKNNDSKSEKPTEAEKSEKISLNSLEKAQLAQTGVVQKNKGWRELNDESSEEYKKLEKTMNEGNDNVDKVVDENCVVKTTLAFAKGEISKEIFIHVPDDDVSDGQVEAMYALTNAKKIEISEAKTGSIIINDNEKAEKAKYEFGKSSYSVSSAKDSLTVTVKKTAGTEQLSVVNVVTADGTARSGSEYDSVSESLVFAKDVKEQKVKIPLNGSISEDKYFFIGLGDGRGNTYEDSLTTVTLKADKKSKISTGAEAKPASGADAGRTYYTYGKNSIDIDVAQWTLHSRYGERWQSKSGSSSGLSVNLKNAKRIYFYNWLDWGNGKQDWSVSVCGSTGEKLQSSAPRTTTEWTKFLP